MKRKLLLNSKQQQKMLGHRNRFQENDDLPVPLWRGQAVKKKLLQFFNVRTLITCKIMRSKDAQCNTG